MNGFCPEGYVSTQKAIVTGARYWFPEKAAAQQIETKPSNSFEADARALPQSPAIADALRHVFRDIVNQTVHRLRNALHKGKLNAYYFAEYGCHSVSREFWATEQAGGVMESGIYWPFGRPTRTYDSRPNYPLFLLQSELDALLSERPAKKRPFPNAKMPTLVAALRNLDDLPNRTDQLQALSNMPDFREHTITDALFRKAAKEAGPRRPGRKSRR
jgi:hypothetical protein